MREANRKESQRKPEEIDANNAMSQSVISRIEKKLNND